VRGSFDGFRALGVRKLDALLPVLRKGIHIVLSDVDCVWSSSPLPMFEGRVVRGRGSGITFARSTHAIRLSA